MTWRQLVDPENPENRNAGNGGDLVKHTVYLATLDYLLARRPWSDAIRIRECHAGRGMYAVPIADTGRRPLLECLYDPVDSDVGVLLHDVQRAAQTALRTWPDRASAFEWYAGSAVTNAWRLGSGQTGQHLLDLYEYEPDTRQILRRVFATPNRLSLGAQVHIRPEAEDGREFDGERYIENKAPEWNGQDLILLDPFAMWRQAPDQAKRDRYRRILDRLIMRGQDAPMFILFWTWGRAFPVADGDLDGTGTPVANGYQELRSVLHEAGRPFILVTWRWGLQFAMWVSVPGTHLTKLGDLIQQRCDELQAHLQQHGCGNRLEHPTVLVRIDAPHSDGRTSADAVVVLLTDVVDAMDLPNENWTSYFNPRTGEIVTVTDEDRQLVEDEDLDEQALPDWQRDSLVESRLALESGEFLTLPDKFEIHEWGMMERFANVQAPEARSVELLDAIHRTGAFRSFRSAIRRLGIEDEWFRFRQAAYEEIAKGWMEKHGISFR